MYTKIPNWIIYYNIYKMQQYTHHKYILIDAHRSRWVQSQATKDGADSDVAKYDGTFQLLLFTLTVYL